MNALQAILLGALQGLTEFIPISSSAHLVIIRWFFGWENKDLVFDVALHLGTLFALLAFFWREWYDMIKSYIATTKIGTAISGTPLPQEQAQGMLIWPVVFACIPAGLAGMLLEHQAEAIFRQRPYLTAAALIGMGVLLLAGDRIGKKYRSMQEIRPVDWIIIGLAQALAIVPGVSRSGITITAGLFCGLQRDTSARFSFLLGAPIIFGAAVYELPKAFRHGVASSEIIPLILGVVTSTIVGYLCIGFLLRYLRKQGVGLFVWYRILLGISLIASHALGYLRI